MGVIFSLPYKNACIAHFFMYFCVPYQYYTQYSVAVPNLLFCPMTLSNNLWWKRATYYAPFVMGIALYVYIIARAYMVSMTHDEVNTCIVYAPKAIWDIVTYTDPIPNNHILHTLLVKLCENLLGISQITVRLPNLLGFSLYLLSTWAFMRACRSVAYMPAFAFCVLFCNPFLIDFFSLARGYALSIDFMLAACYMAYCYLQQPQTKYLVAAVVLSILAPYTNFTTLNFYAPFTGLLLLFIAQEAFNISNNKQKVNYLFKNAAIVLLGALVLAFISYMPIKQMLATDQFHFWGSKGFYDDTLKTLTYMSLDGQSYLKKYETTVSVMTNFLVFYLLILYAALSINLWNKKMQLRGNPFAFFALLLFGAIASVVVQYHLLATPYVTTRTALFYYPLFALATLFFLVQLAQFKGKIHRPLTISLLVFMGFHFVRTVNLKDAAEWWYNQDDKVVINYLEKQYTESKRSTPISLNASWIFIPTLHFYDQTDSIKWLDVTPWHSELDTSGNYEYYYVESKDAEVLKSKYDSVLSFEWNGRLLLKRKDSSSAQ